MNPTPKFRTTQWFPAAGRVLSAIPLLLISCWALAASLDEAANAPPTQGVALVYVVLFIVLFVGMIVGFFVYLWWLDKNRKQGR